MSRAAMLPVIGALLANAALALSLFHGPQSRGPWEGFMNAWWPVIITLWIAFCVCAAALIRRAGDMVADGDRRMLLIPLLLFLAVLAIWVSHVSAHREYEAAPAMLSLAGWLLIAVTLAGPALRAARSGTPWQTLSGGDTTGDRTHAIFRIAGPVLTGIGAVGFAALLGAPGDPFSAAGKALGGVQIGSWLVALVLLWLAVLVVRSYGTAAVRRRAGTYLSGPEIAAHLHDGVLQQLALIGKSADDPAAVRSLTRATERDLRDWLAGRSTAPTHLSPALGQLAAQIEQEHAEARVEVVTVKDTDVGERVSQLLDATREALRNAVRHGGGAANVFAEVEADGTVTVYVRDTGTGFDPDGIPDDRCGVRDAIIGRMEAVGGHASIDSTPEGTEVTLVLPPGGP